MTLTQKENELLKDLKTQEKLCIEKYAKHSAAACDCQLKNLFSYIGQVEQSHLETLDKISSGVVPDISVKSVSKPAMADNCTCPHDSNQKNNDSYLCTDALTMEKHASSLYDTCIFEFKDPGLRNVLNHIQKEEQKHGEDISEYMTKNNMYA